MSLRCVGCRIGVHRWGALQGDGGGAFRRCGCCQDVQLVDTGRPIEFHDKLCLRRDL